MVAFSWLLAHYQLIVIAEAYIQMGCGLPNARLVSLNDAAVCESPFEPGTHQFIVFRNGYPGYIWTAEMDDNPTEVAWSNTRSDSPCPASGICTNRDPPARIPAGTKCYTWVHTENEGTKDAQSWQIWGFFVAGQEDSHGPRIAICNAACTGYNALKC